VETALVKSSLHLAVPSHVQDVLAMFWPDRGWLYRLDTKDYRFHLKK